MALGGTARRFSNPRRYQRPKCTCFGRPCRSCEDTVADSNWCVQDGTDDSGEMGDLCRWRDCKPNARQSHMPVRGPAGRSIALPHQSQAASVCQRKILVRKPRDSYRICLRTQSKATYPDKLRPDSPDGRAAHGDVVQSFAPYTISSIDWLDEGLPDSTSPANCIHAPSPRVGSVSRMARRMNSAMEIPSAAACSLAIVLGLFQTNPCSDHDVTRRTPMITNAQSRPVISLYQIQTISQISA